MTNRKIDAMLFDFDGTLADTSFDMVNCLNILLENHKKGKVELDIAKNYISKGAAGLIDFSCPKISSSDRSKLITEYLEIYKENRDQISNPDLIFPGQVFSIPKKN